MRLFEILNEAYEPGEYGGKHNLSHGQGLGQQPIPPGKYEDIGNAIGRKLDPAHVYYADVCSQCHGSGKSYSPTAGKIQPGNPHQNPTGGTFGGGCPNKNCTSGFWVGPGHKVLDAGPRDAAKPAEISMKLEFEIGKSKDNPNENTRNFTRSSDENARLFRWARVRAEAGDAKLGRLFMNIVKGMYTADMEDEDHVLAKEYSAWNAKRTKEKDEVTKSMDPGLLAAKRLGDVPKNANQQTIGRKAQKFK